MLELRNVTKRFFPHTINERIALDEVELVVDDKDFITVIGSNGAGKSTLLNCISGRHSIDEGQLIVDGKDISKVPEHRRARYVARVFQDPMAGTFPHLTIEENLAIAFGRNSKRGFGLAVTKRRRELFQKALATLELGLEDRLTLRVGMLSGGQRQALSLLMATYVRPDILLLDEHTAALDPSRAELITRLTKEIVADHGLTAIMVTHNMQQAIELGNRLIMMHEGRIVLDIEGEQKQNTSPDELLAEFAKIKGAVMDDRTLLD